MANLPTNIKTGVDNNDLNNLEKQEIEINVTSSIMTFMSYAIKSSTIYVEHSNRTVVTTDDIKKAMMVEVFTYFDRTDLEQRITEWRQTIIEDMQNETSESDEEYEDEDINQSIEDSSNNTTNCCNCNICSTMNTIEEKWKYYNPSDQLGIIFKKHIDNI